MSPRTRTEDTNLEPLTYNQIDDLANSVLKNKCSLDEAIEFSGLYVSNEDKVKVVRTLNIKIANQILNVSCMLHEIELKLAKGEYDEYCSYEALIETHATELNQINQLRKLVVWSKI